MKKRKLRGKPRKGNHRREEKEGKEKGKGKNAAVEEKSG